MRLVFPKCFGDTPRPGGTPWGPFPDPANPPEPTDRWSECASGETVTAVMAGRGNRDMARRTVFEPLPASPLPERSPRSDAPDATRHEQSHPDADADLPGVAA